MPKTRIDKSVGVCKALLFSHRLVYMLYTQILGKSIHKSPSPVEDCWHQHFIIDLMTHALVRQCSLATQFYPLVDVSTLI